MKSIDFDIEIRKRFDHEKVAENYLRRKHVRDTPKNRRELACMRRAIASIPEGVTVLDLPTGTGRLIPMLLEHGVRVIAADYSEHMLSTAESYFKTGEHALSRDLLDRISFQQQDVMDIRLNDGTVHTSISNRLFHHYPTSELRRRALGELARVTSDTIIVSYFSNVAVSALRFHAKNKLLRRNRMDRAPIWPSLFEKDIESCGLRVTGKLPVRIGLSPQTYLVLGKQ